MRINEQPVDRIPAGTWDSFLDCCGEPSPFARHAWLSLIADAFPGWRVNILTATDGDRLHAAFCFVDRSGALSFQSHALPWGCPGALAVDPDAPPDTADRLLGHWLRDRRQVKLLRRLSVTFPTDRAPGLELLRGNGFELRTERTWCIDLRDRTFGQWEQSLPQNVRNKNRQALKRGCVLEEACGPEEAPGLYRLARLTAGLHHRPAPNYSLRFYRRLLDPRGPLSADPGLCRVWVVRAGGRAVAFNLGLVHAGTAWLFDHGADSEAFDLRPNNLIYRGIVEWAFSAGLHTVDMGVVPGGAGSLESFKQGFGAKPRERVSAVYAPPMFGAAAAARRVVRRLFPRKG